MLANTSASQALSPLLPQRLRALSVATLCVATECRAAYSAGDTTCRQSRSAAGNNNAGPRGWPPAFLTGVHYIVCLHTARHRCREGAHPSRILVEI